jgi:hypothetical protein
MKTIKDYIGKKFLYVTHPETVYTVQECIQDLVKISWDGGDVHYGLSEVMRLFAEGACEFIESPKLKINILPTDNPSRLFLSDYGKELNLSGYPLRNYTTGQHIYITSSEKIVLDDYGLGFAHGIKGTGRGHFVFKQDGTNVGKINALCADARKIVLTTNQELIDKGIQPINDDFLFWFVNNPSCEEVDFLRCPIEGLYTLITQDETDHLLSTLANKKRLMEDVANNEPTLTSEEFFRKKLKEINPSQSVITLSREMITAEQGMMWAKEYSDYINKQEKR